MGNAILGRHLHLHFIVILLGFTAILGALITLPAMELVWYRMLISFIALWLFFLFRKIAFRLPARKILPLLGIGVVVALHWITFFHAIKVSNVSVTLGVFASTTLFTSFLEPLTQKRRIFWLEVLIGLVIIGGIYLIFQYEVHFLEGILYSLLSALLNGLFVVLNRNISLRHHPSVISFYEMIGGFLFISLFLATQQGFTASFFVLSAADVFYLLILGSVCTAYAFTAIVDVMKVLSAYTVVLAVNLEPVYGIVMARFFFPEAERMSGGFYVGTLIILTSVFAYPFLKRKFRKK
ncbi:MAG: DMT family transporter [Bacteroidales bacterium]|nr:DMT family transporter [Bacteroidales bacterium]